MINLSTGKNPLVIKSLMDAVGLMNRPEFLELVKRPRNSESGKRRRNSAFGIWFRGQDNNEHDLIPSVLRKGQHGDETAMMYHFLVTELWEWKTQISLNYTIGKLV